MKIFEFDKLTKNISNNKGTSYQVKNIYGYTSNINKGEAKEYDLKQYFFGSQLYLKDSTSHLTNSDIVIGSKNISVKSCNCNIFKVVDNDFIKTIKNYLANDYSNTYIYIVEYNNNYLAIEFTKTEFEKFLIDNASIDISNNMLRIRKCDNKIIKWLGI